MTTVREKKINWTSSNLKLSSFKGHNQESEKNPHNGKKCLKILYLTRAGVGNGDLLQYSGLENSMDNGTWQATVHGIVKSWT